MNDRNIAPHIYVLTTLGVVVGAFFVFGALGYHDQFFFAPMLAVAMVWAALNFRRQQRGLSHFRVASGLPFTRLLKKSAVRYAFWLLVLYVGWQAYYLVPIFSPYKNDLFFEYFIQGYAILGLPYFLLTLKFKASRTEDFYDPAIRALHMAKQVVLRLNSRQPLSKVFRVFKSKYNRKVLLNLLMRGYFIPVMVVQVYAGIHHSLEQSVNPTMSWLTLLMWLTTMLWLADALAASVAYSMESRWLENRSRSIDLTLSGWLICLMCYAPLNSVTGTLFAFGPNIATNTPAGLIIPDLTLFYALEIIEVTLLAALVYCDLALGPSLANITLKRLQTRGPYGLVRHPATVCKLSLWWLQAAFYSQFWSWELIVGQLAWSLIYILRAFSEERHLRQFAEYREYMENVKYRFIPGLI